MAIGDAAAAKGLEVVPSTQDLKQGYARINQKGDELAAEMTARAAADTAESVARIAADALKLDAAKVIVQAATPANIAGSGYSGRIWVKRA